MFALKRSFNDKPASNVKPNFICFDNRLMSFCKLALISCHTMQIDAGESIDIGLR